MKHLKTKLAASGLVTMVVLLRSAGVADARLAANHNETLLRDER